MRTISVNLYQFDELPTDAARERARQWWREASAGENYFSECVISEALEWLRALGFSIDSRPGHGVQWSGFCSQGDGASFIGTWRAERSGNQREALAKLRTDRPATYTDAAGALQTCKSNAAWHLIADRIEAIAARAPGMFAALEDSRAHYVHEYTVRIECDGFDAEQSDAVNKALDAEFTEVCRDAMRLIYREVESAYEWENADAQIDDCMRANEYEFTENGAIA